MKFNYEVQLDLHGLNSDQAQRDVEEAVFVNEKSRIMIVHGKGDGVLRRKVREFLLDSEYVKKVEFGEEINIPGGVGVTVAHTR